MCGSRWAGLALALSVIRASRKIDYSQGSDVLPSPTHTSNLMAPEFSRVYNHGRDSGVERVATQARAVLTLQQLEGLTLALHDRGYQVVGPAVRDGAIVYDNRRAHRRCGAASGSVRAPVHPSSLLEDQKAFPECMWSVRRAGRNIYTRPRFDYSLRSAAAKPFVS
jgi:hypothetical protein